MTEGLERARVWPTGGDVPHEHTGQPIQPGEEITLTRYALRRLSDGSLTREDPSLKQPQEEQTPVEPSGPTGTLRPRRLRERDRDPYTKPVLEERERADPPSASPEGVQPGEAGASASVSHDVDPATGLDKEKI